MNGGQVRDTWFCPAGKGVPGYDARQVDDLLRRVAGELDAERSAGQVIRNATFQRVQFRRCYDIDAVDRLLDRFLPRGRFEQGEIVDDPWGDLPVARLGEGNSKKYNFYSRCENAWREFGQVPGTRLWVGKAARGLTELPTGPSRGDASVPPARRAARRRRPAPPRTGGSGHPRVRGIGVVGHLPGDTVVHMHRTELYCSDGRYTA